MQVEQHLNTSRRAFLVGAAGAVASLGALARASTVSTAQTDIGNCADEPAIDLFLAWDSGRIPYPVPGEPAPPLDWTQVHLPGATPPWAIPPGWSISQLVAENVSRDGSVRWRRQVSGLPLLELIRVESEDGSALFETALGTLDGLVLGPGDISDIAVISLLGADTRLRNVCYLDNDGTASSAVFRRVERAGRELLYSFGSATPMPDPNFPSTIFYWFNFLGPRREMEDLMWNAFIPLMEQFLVKGGGGSDPTPTPTPDV